MRITNKFNLPEAVLNVISKDHYVRGDNNYSVTELIESPQVVQLKRRHWDDLTEDAIDRVWSIFGSAVHHIMESHASDESFVEQRYYIQRLGRTIGGMVDCYNDGVVHDYKVTSAWSLVYGSRTAHWEQQLNMYAHILRENNIPVNKLQIVAFLRDWDRNKAKQDSTYPQVPLMIIPLRLWSSDECEEYLLERLMLHIENEDKQECTPCTPEECWEQPTKYAVTKIDAKRATRVFDTEQEAVVFIYEQKKPEEFITVVRNGKRTRCEDYCSLCHFCPQYLEYVESQSNG